MTTFVVTGKMVCRLEHIFQSTSILKMWLPMLWLGYVNHWNGNQLTTGTGK